MNKRDPEILVGILLTASVPSSPRYAEKVAEGVDVHTQTGCCKGTSMLCIDAYCGAFLLPSGSLRPLPLRGCVGNGSRAGLANHTTAIINEWRDVHKGSRALRSEHDHAKGFACPSTVCKFFSPNLPQLFPIAHTHAHTLKQGIVLLIGRREIQLCAAAHKIHVDHDGGFCVPSTTLDREGGPRPSIQRKAAQSARLRYTALLLPDT